MIQNEQKSNMLTKIQNIYSEMKKIFENHDMKKQNEKLLEKYHQEVTKIINSQKIFKQQQSKISTQTSLQNSRTKQQQTYLQLSNSVKESTEQSQYLFLRNAWQQKYSKPQDQEIQDQIDRINKTVALIRNRTNYMIKKQNYLYQKQQSNHQHLYLNPIFMKLKEQLEKSNMNHQSLLQKYHQKEQTINKLLKQKSYLQDQISNLKKKYQQMQKSYIQVSNKNIALEQQSLMLKSQNSKNKLNYLRQSSDLNMYSIFNLKRSSSFKKLHQEVSQQQKTKQNNQLKQINQNSKETVFTSLDNMFIDINLNLSNKKQVKQSKISNRYGNIDCQNQQNLNSTLIPQKIAAQKIIDTCNQKLALCRSQRLLVDGEPMRFRNIRNQGSNRKQLLSSARSVDLIQNTSLNKPKFQRTRPNNNLLRSISKDINKINVTNQIKIQRPNVLSQTIMTQKQSLLRKHHITSQESNILKSFKSSPRQLISKRQQIQ